MKGLADDRQLAARQLDLAALQQRIEEAIGRWQVLAVTGQILESIRASYETDRQPETLQEASGYFSQMTQGHYRRVWTPVGERILRVEDAAGHWLPVEVLSRGAREQLFLSLRLSLAAYFARRGAAAAADSRRRAGELRQARGPRRPPRCCAILPPKGTRCSSSPATNTSPSFSAA